MVRLAPKLGRTVEVLPAPRWFPTRRRSRAGAAPWRPETSRLIGAALVAPLVALFGVFFLWPLAKLVESSLPGASLSVYRRFFTSAGDVRALERTLSLTAVVTVMALALGLFIAWELRLASGRRKSVILAIVVFPVWTSVIVRIYALTILFERHGIINNALVGAGIRDQPVQLLYTNKAVVVGMLYTVLPYATLPIYASLANVELELTAAAESLGASKTRAFWTIVVPLILPALVATGALVFVLGLGFYVTPLLLGNSTAPFLAGTISNDIFVFFDVPSAAAAGVVLIVIAFGCMAVTWRVVGVERLQRAVVA